jgi:long-chain fatty acid transport protein
MQLVRNPVRKLGLGLVGLVVASSAGASGFSIFEQGTKASGVSGAWVALADDASANWYNPAALVWLEGNQFQIGTNLITAGGDTEFTSADPAFGLRQATTFEPDGSIETPSHFYYTHKVNPNFAFGIGVTNPFGLVTSWDTRPITFSAVESELVTFVVNPNVAMRLTDEWSIAIGANYMLADVKSFSREVPVNLDANPATFEVVGYSNLTGDGSEVGWNVAISRRSSVSSFGLTYRSGFSVDIDGDIEYANFGPIAGFFPSSPGSTVLELPAQAQIGWGFALSNSFWMEVDVAWAEWSAFQELAIDIENNTNFSRDLIVEENWDDSMSYRLGLIWNTSDTSTWRFGVVYDESPVPEETLRPSIPDANRAGASIGYGYKGSRMDFDVYYMALTFDDITATRGAEGVINGTYESFAHLAGFGLNFRF